MTENMGKQIRAGRQRSSLTQEKLAEALGVTPQAVSKWERGESLPDIALLPELSAALGLTLDELFESSAETHLRRIQQRMENEPRMSLETFRQAESQLRQDALETEYRPRCLTLLAELYNHMAEGFRARAEEGMVIEEDSQYYVGYPYLLLPEIQSSGITDPLLSEGYYVTAPAAQGLRVTGSADVTELLTTSDTAYSKAAGYAITTYEREDGDSSGPFALAVRIGTDGGGEMVWVASGYFLEDAYNDYSSGANLNFTMNALSELMGESDTLAIRSKSLSYTYLTISESSAARLKTLLIGVLPGAFLLYGIFTVVERRRKRDA